MRFSNTAKKRFLLTAEFNSRMGMPFAEKVKEIVDGMTVPAPKKQSQNPDSGNPEIKSVKTAAELKKAGIESAPTLTCRDHPKEDGEIIEMLEESGIENVLVLWGSPHSASFRGSYNFDKTFSLIRWLAEEELDACFIVASDPGAANKPWQIPELKKKADAGASIAITGPVFDAGTAKRFFEKIRMEVENLRIVAGLMPLGSAEEISLAERTLGTTIPAEAKKRILASESGGFELVLEIAEELRERADGFHLFTAGKEEKTIELLKALR